jgi:hypothetical protein
MTTLKSKLKAYLAKRSIRDFRVFKVKGADAAADVDANDPDFFTEQLALNTGEYTITGATAGIYTLAIQDAKTNIELARVTYTAGGGDTNADIASGISAAINTAINLTDDTVISRHIESSAYAAGDEFSIRWAQNIRVNAVLTAPGGTWLPQSAADATGTCEQWPATLAIPNVERGGEGANVSVEVMVVGIDSSGNVVAPQGTYTMDMLQEVELTNDANEVIVAIATRGSDPATAVGAVHTVACNGGTFGVRMHTIAGEAAGVDRWAILGRAVVT